MLAIGLAMLTLLFSRTPPVHRKRVGPYEAYLAGIGVIAAYTIVCDVLGWWAWTQVAEQPGTFLLGLSGTAWFALAFSFPALFAFACFLFAAISLCARLRKVHWRKTPL